jgi:hypothetical protein
MMPAAPRTTPTPRKTRAKTTAPDKRNDDDEDND